MQGMHGLSSGSPKVALSGDNSAPNVGGQLGSCSHIHAVLLATKCSTYIIQRDAGYTLCL
jgi:hypothetical protein